MVIRIRVIEALIKGPISYDNKERKSVDILDSKSLLGISSDQMI